MVFQFLGKCKAFIRNLFTVPTEEVWDKIEDVLLQCDHVSDTGVIDLLPIEEIVEEQPVLLLEAPKVEIQPEVAEVLDVFPEVVEETEEQVIEIVEVPTDHATDQVEEEVEQLELDFDAVSDIVNEPIKEEIGEEIKIEIPEDIIEQISILPQIIESVQQFIESREVVPEPIQETVQEINLPEIPDSSETEQVHDEIKEPTPSICQRIKRVRKKILRYRSAELVPIPREIQQRQAQMKSGGVTIITYPGVRNHRNGCNPINFRTINMNGVTPKAL